MRIASDSAKSQRFAAKNLRIVRIFSGMQVASKQRLLFESPALFEGVNIIRMGVNIVRIHAYKVNTYIFHSVPS